MYVNEDMIVGVSLIAGHSARRPRLDRKRVFPQCLSVPLSVRQCANGMKGRREGQSSRSFSGD